MDAISASIGPVPLLLVAVAGWMNQQQQHAIEYSSPHTRCFVSFQSDPVSGHYGHDSHYSGS
jgi:hypothetical protein